MKAPAYARRAVNRKQQGRADEDTTWVVCKSKTLEAFSPLGSLDRSIVRWYTYLVPWQQALG